MEKTEVSREKKIVKCFQNLVGFTKLMRLTSLMNLVSLTNFIKLYEPHEVQELQQPHQNLPILADWGLVVMQLRVSFFLFFVGLYWCCK